MRRLRCAPPSWYRSWLRWSMSRRVERGTVSVPVSARAFCMFLLGSTRPVGLCRASSELVFSLRRKIRATSSWRSCRWCWTPSSNTGSSLALTDRIQRQQSRSKAWTDINLGPRSWSTQQRDHAGGLTTAHLYVQAECCSVGLVGVCHWPGRYAGSQCMLDSAYVMRQQCLVVRE